MRGWQRWAAVGTGLAVLAAVPSLVAARPVHDAGASASALLARVRASTSVSYSGLVETHGSLSLPDIPQAGDLAALLSSTTRLRVWWSDARHFRVDQLAAGGESDTTVTGRVTQQWDSTRDRLVESVNSTPLRIPRAPDLLPPDLAERLAPQDLPATATRLPAQRVAGRTTLGLRLTPTNRNTTVGYVDIDVDAATGLPLRVAVVPRGTDRAAVSSGFLEVTIKRPTTPDTRFTAPAGAIITELLTPDFVAEAARQAPFVLPSTLAGLPRTQRVTRLGVNAGAATYGRGYALVALVPLRLGLEAQVFAALKPPIGLIADIGRPLAHVVAERLPLANVLVMATAGGSFVLSGTVSLAVLERAARQLVDHPPHFAAGPQRS